MLVTEPKPKEELLENIKGEKKVFILACGGCAEVCSTGGMKAAEELKKTLVENGKEVTGVVEIDFICNKVLVATRLERFIDPIREADSVLVMSCGVGVQAVANVIDKITHPTSNTISMGGFQGVWTSAERCAECGDCLLDMTGGICPITGCSKSLVNGPCGGSSNDECEVEKERKCGWVRIYERLKSVDKLDNLTKVNKPRDFEKMWPKKDKRQTPYWSVDTEEN
jgi:electron transport complex protein RnfC